MKISAVSTLFNCARTIKEFHSRLSTECQKHAGSDYEIVLVNDGSTDDTLESVLEIQVTDSKLKIVDLSRNFGQHHALMAGLAHSTGDLVFMLDSDLEEPPELLTPLLEKKMQSRCDVVYGIQQERKGGLFEKTSGRFFYLLLNSISRVKIPVSAITARVMSRKYVDALLLYKDKELFMAGIWQLAGFNQQQLLVSKRDKGHSGYKFRNKVSMAMSAITSFSTAPLKAISYFGIATSSLAIGVVFYLLYGWLFLERAISGWTSLVTSIWLLGGLNSLFLGIVGLYVSRIFLEVKDRPTYVVRRIYEREED